MSRYIRHIVPFVIILFLVVSYLYYTGNSPQKMSYDNRRELNILNGLIKKKLYFRDSLKCQMDSVMLQLHKHTDYNDDFRYYTNRRMLQDAQMFSYDYASEFSRKMRMLSDRLGDGNLMAESRILSSFNMAQACLFVEALDMLKSVDLEFPM